MPIIDEHWTASGTVARGADFDIDGAVCVRDASGEVVALMWDYQTRCVCAAAPDMLRALKAIIAELPGAGLDRLHPLSIQIQNAEAIVLKAEG
jgi:DNA-binding transcriptional LysR family regulator